jgi:creatinine amidohydrolase
VSETWDTFPLKEGIGPQISGSHAGEFEASMLSAIRPDLVKKENLAQGDPRPLADILEPMMINGIHTISKNGVLGDQRFANPERGQKYLDCLSDWLAADIKKQTNADEY